MTFLDMTVFTPSTNSYTNQVLSKSYEVKEKEKKGADNQRVQPVEHGTLTPVVLFSTDNMRRECKNFYSQLSKMVSNKQIHPNSFAAAWIRKKVSFSLVKSISLFISGSSQWIRAMNLFSLLLTMLLSMKLTAWLKWTIFLNFYLVIYCIYFFFIIFIVIFDLRLVRKCISIVIGRKMQ